MSFEIIFNSRYKVQLIFLCSPTANVNLRFYWVSIAVIRKSKWVESISTILSSWSKEVVTNSCEVNMLYHFLLHEYIVQHVWLYIWNILCRFIYWYKIKNLHLFIFYHMYVLFLLYQIILILFVWQFRFIYCQLSIIPKSSIVWISLSITWQSISILPFLLEL